jgi:hypothetical protein
MQDFNHPTVEGVLTELNIVANRLAAGKYDDMPPDPAITSS